MTPLKNETITPAIAELNTIYVSVEVSRKSWIVGLKSPTKDKISIYTLDPADVAGLKALIDRHRARAQHTLDRELRVLVCYEAGYEGFWLARWLDQEMGLEAVVLDPASLLVNRKSKKRKTDRIDARKMVRSLMGYDRGDSEVLSRVRVPSVDEEDRKRLLRERKRLVAAQTSLTNTINGLLKLHGIFDLNPRNKDFAERFADAQTAYGTPFPKLARQEIERILARLELVREQIAEIEAERDATASAGAKLSIADTLEGSDEAAAAQIAALSQLKGIGANDAMLLVNEVYYRDFRNRRELAGWVGITAAPWSSGDTERDQGVGRDGPGWIRANLIQMAWRWVRYQPDTDLAKWFADRTADGSKLTRKRMIVAVARKLLIALWRLSQNGLVPTGARFM